MSNNEIWMDTIPTEAGMYWYCGIRSCYEVVLVCARYDIVGKMVVYLVTNTKSAYADITTTYPPHQLTDLLMPGRWRKINPPPVPAINSLSLNKNDQDNKVLNEQ